MQAPLGVRALEKQPQQPRGSDPIMAGIMDEVRTKCCIQKYSELWGGGEGIEFRLVKHELNVSSDFTSITSDRLYCKN